jgi:hypothetical protein
MTLSEKQQDFAQAVAGLIYEAVRLGYAITFGDAYRDPRVLYVMKTSLHRIRLAIDLNVFKDGKYLTDGSMYTDLGEYWESVGGAWGGRFQDGNHFSFEHEGRK